VCISPLLIRLSRHHVVKNDAVCFNSTVSVLIIIRGATGSDEPWPAEQPPLAVFPGCTRRYWVDMWSAHRIPQLHFQLSKPDR
jgi:hypothetical protein